MRVFSIVFACLCLVIAVQCGCWADDKKPKDDKPIAKDASATKEDAKDPKKKD